MPLADVKLDDKYTLERGRVYLNGIQALTRLLIMQRVRDRRFQRICAAVLVVFARS